MAKKVKSDIPILDSSGEIVFRATVSDLKAGLRGADLQGLIAPLAQLQGLDLTGANLYWASLRNADLSFANLSDADLRGASLDGANLRGAILRRAKCGLDNLGGRTSLRGADLSTAQLDGAHLDGAVFDDSTRFPAEFDPENARMTHVDTLPPDDPSRIG